MAYYDIYPTLWAAASGNQNGIQNKFPFLCDLEPMIQAISDSNLLDNSRTNPNGYNKYEMAEAAIDYIDRFCDYTTGKAPRALLQPYEFGYIMSQAQYWDNLNFGMYIVGEDPGWGTDGAALTFGGHHYLTAPSSINETQPAGTYHSNPLTFNLTTTLHTSSFIEYIDSGLTSGALPIINTTDTGITSDDIVGLSYQVSGLKGEDVDGNELDLTGWHFPMGIPGLSKIYAGRRTDWLTSNDIVLGYSVTQGEIDATKTLYGYSGSPTLTQYIGSYVAPFVHFAEDAGFSNKVNSLVGAPSDVAPEYKFVTLPYNLPSPTTTSLPSWERTRDTYVAFDVFSMETREGDYIPATATLNGIWDGSNFLNGTDVDIDPATGDWWKPNSTGDGELTFFLNSVTNGVETKFRSSQSMSFFGIPYYDLKVQYTYGGQQYIRNFAIPFHYLSQWTLNSNITVGVSLANDDTAGITGDCSAQYTQAGGTVTTATARQGPFVVASVSIENQGRGYTYDQVLTAEFPVGDGRHYQDILGGALLSERSNNNPIGPKNDDTKATVTVDNADFRVTRPVYTYTHGSYPMGINPENYQIRGFLGTDYQYQKDNWARRYTLDVSNNINGLSFTGLTHTDTIGIDEAPGLEYGPDSYHADQNPHGSDTQYVSHTWGSGIDDERWYAKNKGVFDITITDGRVTAVTPRSLNDGEGTPCEGGWGYSTTDIRYTELGLFSDTPFSDESIAPVINVRNDTAADNGYGNKVTFNINDQNNGFYPGKNLPDGHYTYGIAYDSANGFYNGVSDNFDMPNWYDRNWVTSVDPSSVRIGVERPVLTSQTRSLKTISVGTGAHRYTFELEYPPMTQDEAMNVIRLFDKLKGPTQAIQLALPRTAVKHIEGWTYYNKPRMANNLVINEATSVGDTEITLSGFEAYQTPSIPSGTLFTSISVDKIYQVVDSTNADEFGRAKILIEPPLLGGLGYFIRGKARTQDRADYMYLKVFMMDDKIDYTIDAAGYYRLTAIKFREALKDE